MAHQVVQLHEEAKAITHRRRKQEAAAGTARRPAPSTDRSEGG